MAMITAQQCRLGMLTLIGAVVIFFAALYCYGQDATINSLTLSRAVIGPDGSNYVMGAAVKAWTNVAPPIPQASVVPRRYRTATITRQATQLAAKPVVVPLDPPRWKVQWFIVGGVIHYDTATSLTGPWTEVLVTNAPTQTVTLPITGGAGYARTRLDWSGQAAAVVTTNSPTP